MMRKIIKILSRAIVGLLVSLYFFAQIGSPTGILSIFGVKAIMCFIFIGAILGAVDVGHFGMGCGKASSDNLIIRLAPLYILALLFFLIAMSPQTYVSAAFVGFMLGTGSAYIGDIVGLVIIKTLKVR